MCASRTRYMGIFFLFPKLYTYETDVICKSTKVSLTAQGYFSKMSHPSQRRYRPSVTSNYTVFIAKEKNANDGAHLNCFNYNYVHFSFPRILSIAVKENNNYIFIFCIYISRKLFVKILRIRILQDLISRPFRFLAGNSLVHLGETVWLAT